MGTIKRSSSTTATAEATGQSRFEKNSSHRVLLLEKEKKILLYRFSFYGGKKYTLKSIGEELGISPETVRQIEIRAIRKLKEYAEELQDYVYK